MENPNPQAVYPFSEDITSRFFNAADMSSCMLKGYEFMQNTIFTLVTPGHVVPLVFLVELNTLFPFLTIISTVRITISKTIRPFT
jgi:hypothetical protein